MWDRSAAIVFALCPLVFAMASCSTAPPGRGIHEHEELAAEEEKRADEHDALFDENTAAVSGSCSLYCFETWSNPTAEHLKSARKHRRAAARHRRASQKLRATEKNACGGIPERDRDISPFFHVSDIASVSVVEDTSIYEVRFKAVVGLDAQRMQELIDCHMARAAALGSLHDDMPYCPLVIPGLRASVTEGEAGSILVLLQMSGAESSVALKERMERLNQQLVE